MSEQAQQTPEKPSKGNGNGKRKQLMMKIGGVFALAAIAYGAYYLFYQRFHEETDDAYVNGNLVYVNAQVAGTVVSIGADDTQLVKVGSSLVRFDGADTAVALAQAEAALASSIRQMRQSFSNVDQNTAVLEQKKSDIAQREADLAKAKEDLARRLQLSGTDAVAGEDIAHAKAAVQNAQAALDSAKAALVVAQRQLEVSRALTDRTTLTDSPSVRQARANYEQAYINNVRGSVPAPITGFVAKRSVQVGQRVSPGTTLMAIVPLNNLWVDANMKESQLTDIRIGQPAEVTTDVYGSRVTYHGKVAGIGAGTGSAFSLLPAQNATGNWIKVVQRVPVRIALDPKDLEQHPLRIGLSTVVNVDTHDRSGSALTALAVNRALATPVYDDQLKAARASAQAIIQREAGKPVQP
ncbi:HlyD family efflux transporter periplasmic adaptor subunit [Crenobacter sp. SG2303]|uniref:HlyD family efflux transporter periplasmic adaptor subunit n=1 Tax=Crenobacter oryzisoli TaxID=3056844 RepID=A0ABT7XLQ7_9NEIS|nr:HlyD family efflux transporter periplasmic adaptor subunit [Crenobacter sp. SG2303]MDN0074710.1 HlyD family efflux transporter periplasmic adaptor subunit [Crenobacter sp. SG2303]